MVVVPKNNGKWRRCVNYTNLNKVYPNDKYPLPCIDQLVDSVSRHEVLFFLDAYSGYNQIPIDPDDVKTNCLHHRTWNLLLHGDALRVKKMQV